MDPAQNTGTDDTAAVAAEEAEDQGWEQAMDNLRSEHGIKSEEKKPAADEENPDKPTDQQTPEEKKAAEDAAADAAAKKAADEKEAELAKNETPEQTEARHKKELELAESLNKDPVNTQQPPTRQDVLEQEKAVQDDIREKMFKDQPTELLDRDGQPIKTIEDVMQYIDNRTGKPFTEEAAAKWLLKAQQDLNAKNEENEAQIKKLADLHLSLAEQADEMKAKYKPLLDSLDKKIPGFAKALWDKYASTFERDKTTDIILKAPISLKWFYDTQLAPYEHLETEIGIKDEAREKAEKEAADLKKRQEQNDRSDIYGGAPENKSPEDEEDEGWGKAFKKHYEG